MNESAEDLKIRAGKGVVSPTFVYAPVIADTRNHAVWSYDVRTYRVALLAGSPGAHGDRDGAGERARFWLPIGVALATEGRGFIVHEARGQRLVSRAGDVRTMGR